eukprot:Gb_04493 [translate_table: standard]
MSWWVLALGAIVGAKTCAVRRAIKPRNIKGLSLQQVSVMMMSEDVVIATRLRVSVLRKPLKNQLLTVDGKGGEWRSTVDESKNSSAFVEDPEIVAQMVERSVYNSSRRQLGYLSCGTGNPIDDCWRCDPDWESNRKRLADCAIGFGRNAIGGKNGRIYVVTDPRDDDPVNPRPGTLRHAVIQFEPLWIIFERDMVIQLKEELIMNSFKTIDGRGANVHIANGPCITVQYVTNIIIHGIHIHDCRPSGNAMVRSSPTHYGWRTMCDGDGVSIFGGSHVWVDHCSLSACADGLIDAIMASTAITISNNHFTHHDKLQNASPTINSQGNRYLAPKNPFAKEVTKRVDTETSVWKRWNWRSEGDLMRNGAFFIPSGAGASSSYAKASSLGAKSVSHVRALTRTAGVLTCRKGSRC